MDYFLLILAILMMLIGLAGCILPIIPGPPISWIGLLLIEFSRFGNFSSRYLLITALIAIAVTALDYLIPIWSTKKFGGSKAGMWGATIGMIVGIIFSPIGMILGAFAGAVVGEAIEGKDSTSAFKSGFGTFIGFMLGIGLKLITSIIFTFHFVKELIQNMEFSFN